MNDEELNALRHAAERSNGWILAHPDSELHKTCEALASRGELECRGVIEWCAGEVAYLLTEAGRSAMRRELASREVKPLTVSQTRYLDYLKVEDHFETFGDYLRYLEEKRAEMGITVKPQRPKQPRRKAISVRGSTYNKLRYFAMISERSVSGLVEEWIAEHIPANLDVPEHAPAGLDAPERRPSQDRRQSEAIADVEPEVELVTDEVAYFPGLAKVEGVAHQVTSSAGDEESEPRGGGIVML